jgi:hypothetical protein
MSGPRASPRRWRKHQQARAPQVSGVWQTQQCPCMGVLARPQLLEDCVLRRCAVDSQVARPMPLRVQLPLLHASWQMQALHHVAP